MATTARGIPLIDGSTKIAPFQAHYNAIAQGLDAALGVVAQGAHAYLGTSAQRAIFLTNATEGDLWTDTNGSRQTWQKISGAWANLRPFTDSGWISPAPLSGVVATNFGLRKIGNIVYCRGQLTRSAGNFPTSTDGMGVFNLPDSSWRPSSYGRIALGAYGTGSAVGMNLIVRDASNLVTVFGTGVSMDAAYLTGVSWVTQG